ncbi:MAG TPA: carboxypeptidase M32, partial [Acetobacteraceae bacterium]|nr:carboxypeptidase M32 [Acetobacteraceae bacterium]
MKIMTPYERLTARFARIDMVQEAIGILGWDEAVMMPPAGAAARADQMATLAGIAHEMLTDPRMGEDIESAGASPPGDAAAARNLALMRHAHRRATALPADLVEAIARASSSCEKIWREARRRSDFAMVAGALGELVVLMREAAACLGEALGLTPYDALMDEHQPGIGAAEVTAIFARYEAFLGRALPLAEEAQARRKARMPGAAPFPEPVQEALCRRLSAGLGLDYAGARLDRSAHPFCGGAPSDIRITTRYDAGDFAVALMGVLHETGHALYEAGLPHAHARQPVGRAAGMAAHESQSLIIEMQAARSDAYLAWLGPVLAEAFGQPAEEFALPRMQARLRRVERGFIRVEADEITYPAHVILRFRLEQALIAGELAVR